MRRFWNPQCSNVAASRRSQPATIVILLLAAWVAVACSAADPAPQARLSGAVVAVVPAGPAAEALRAAAEAYSARTGVLVDVEVLGVERYADQAGAELLGGLGRYDILLLPAEELPRWVRYHTLRPAPAPLDAAGMEPWLPLLETGQGRFGLPTQPEPLALWARVDLLDAAGLAPPADIDALCAAAQALHRPPEQAGMALAGGMQSAGRDLAALVFGFAGTSPGNPLAVDADRSAPATDDPLERALAAYARLGRFAQPGVLSADPSLVTDALARGKAALGFAPLSAAETLLDCAISVCQEDRPLLQPLPLPGADPSAPVGNLSAWVIPLHAPHPDAAGAFLAWLVSDEGARVWADAGGLPAHTALLGELALPGPAGTALANARTYRLMAPQTPAIEAWQRALDEAGYAALAGEIAGQAAAAPPPNLAVAVHALRKASRQGSSLAAPTD